MARKNILQPHVFYRNFMGAYLYFVITIKKNLELFHHWMKFKVGKSRIMVFVVVFYYAAHLRKVAGNIQV